jgi:hypothetical protein
VPTVPLVNVVVVMLGAGATTIGADADLVLSATDVARIETDMLAETLVGAT